MALPRSKIVYETQQLFRITAPTPALLEPYLFKEGWKAKSLSSFGKENMAAVSSNSGIGKTNLDFVR